jgi:hypothetical protein
MTEPLMGAQLSMPRLPTATWKCASFFATLGFLRDSTTTIIGTHSATSKGQ